MVRGPAALLVAQVYLLVAADLLPAPANASDAALAAGATGLAALVLCAAVTASIGDEPLLLGLACAGAGLVAAALAAADVGTAASAAELVAFAGVGALFAIWVQTPALVVALPLFVAAIDVGSGLAGGDQGVAGTLLATTATTSGDLLAAAVPGWEGRPAPARLGVADAVFLGVFLTYARRFDLRPQLVAVASAGWLAALLALELRQGVVVPTVPVLAGVLLVSNLDRLGRVLRA